MSSMRSRAMPYVGRRVLVVHLGSTVGGLVQEVEDEGRRLLVVTDEGEQIVFSLDRATATFTQAGGQTRARLRFVED